MRVVVGIDLGSTTTKAVVLDERGELLGRGITNSRSSYDRAAEVARSEAFVSARFHLLRREVDRAAGPEVLSRLLRAFRLEQSLVQLARLEELILEEVARTCAEALREPASRHVRHLFERLREGEEAAFRLEAPPDRSDFFRDLAAAAYTHLAESLPRPAGVSFDLLLSLFDRCIFKVENEPLELGFEVHIGPALARIGSPDVARAVTFGGGAPPPAPLGGRGVGSLVAAAVAGAVSTPLDVAATVGTGYGRARLPFPKEQIRSEILCHGLGAHAMFPHTRTVLDIGGQDTKAIQVDGRGLVTSFQMNDRCAAGCGRYLGYIADEMNLGLHELGPLAETSRRPVKINSTCTVFAGAELRERLALGERREDILAGLHRAVILRAMSLLARSGGIEDEFTFTGGVAKNPAAVNALVSLVRESYGERTLNVSPDSIFTGALGAALFAHRSASGATSGTEARA